MITFKLNGKEVQGEEGQFILQVAEKYGVEIPTLCHHKALDPAGMCRLCTVELFDGRRTRFVTACNYPVWEGMEVTTDTETVHAGRKLIVEMLLARCPDVPVLLDLSKKYGIEESRFPKEDDTCILCGLCTRVCERMGKSAIRLTGRGLDMKVDTPFHRQTDACIACGACAFVCPTGHITREKIQAHVSKHDLKPIPSEYDMGLAGRKPIYVPYAQAIPNTPVIDRTKCMHFKTGGCKICTEFCGVGAIDYSQEDETIELNVGSIILAPGFESFDPSRFDTYGYGKLSNVVTAMEFERILSATGPYMGHLVRLSDKKEPKKIAWLQCVGSRDLNRCDNSYCSSVCCMYTIKQTVIAMEHSTDPLDCAVFYMDMRTHGKDFDRYYEHAKNNGVRFIRSRVHTIDPVPGTDDLSVCYIQEDGTIKEEVFDMFVLATGLEIHQDVVDLSDRLNIDLDDHNFAQTDSFQPVATSVPGIYASGAFTGPKDIPYSVMEASASACAAEEDLATARNTQTKTLELPQERDVSEELPKIGVFVCNCGINIGGVVRVPEVVEYARTLPNVVYVEENLFSCSQDTQNKITGIISQKGLNRVVVAACTPRTHEELFQETLRDAALNKYLFEMANIRNQCSWVHSEEKEDATEKAKDLVRMAVARAQQLQPLLQPTVSVDNRALVIGGGLSGMAAALGLANQGFHTYLIEQSGELGGNALRLIKTWKGEDISKRVKEMVSQVEDHSLVDVYKEANIKEASGFVGNFETTISKNGADITLKHGAVVVAVGGEEYKPTEYLYGKDKRALTQLELDTAISKGAKEIAEAKIAVFIQCVGQREPERPYCSKVCCTHAIKSALSLKEINPEMDIYVLYRDIRTYGQREELFKEARSRGIIFIQYNIEKKPKVEKSDAGISVTVKDHILDLDLVINADLVVLASGIVPRDNERLSQIYKLSLNEDGFFMEAHAKLRPVEFATDGIYLAGLAHYPKPIEESIAQAKAAASRAAVVLSKENLTVEGAVSNVNETLCRGCGKCEEACPFNAISVIEHEGEKTVSVVQAALCKGCGSCAVACPTGAVSILHFDDRQVLTMVEAAFN